MLYTNKLEHGGIFGRSLENIISEATGKGDPTNIRFAVGYVGCETVSAWSEKFQRIAASGDVQLIVGKALYDGVLRRRTLDGLLRLSESLQSINPASGVRLVTEYPGYHGKLYDFQGGADYLFLGSSNFSGSGLRDNIEVNLLVDQDESKQAVRSFLDWLASDSASTPINLLSHIPSFDELQDPVGSTSLVVPFCPLTHVSEGELIATQANLTGLPYVDVQLRADTHPKSGLNTFMGKGRSPDQRRDWYEVEILSTAAEHQNPNYPSGVFDVITDDGYTFKCQTGSLSTKNFRSSGDLRTLGYWIKRKLVSKGALQIGEITTDDTLAEYGKDFIRLYKIGDAKYYLMF
jgi:hypothetical protein